MPMLTGTNLKYTKAYNSRIVLEMIRLFGPVSRIEVARRTGLTAQTIFNITKELLQAGLIQEAERLQEGRGAPATLMKLNPDGAFSIGLDLDKDHLTGVLVDFAGSMRQRISCELNFPSPAEAMDLLEETALKLIQQEGITRERILGVGVGLPGPIGVSEGSFVTNLVNPKAFPGWTNVPVVDILGKRLDLPIFLENNATAAAAGERWYGAGQHISTFFYIFFGAGLGGGLVINGHPFEGHTGNAGELGYYPTNSEPDETAVFQRPHLGVYFNLPRLYRLLEEQGTPASRASDLEVLSEQRNETLWAWLDTGAAQLAPLILAIEYLIDPEAIFFGGRLPDVLIRALLERLEAILPALRIEGKSGYPRLLRATAGSDAAALGVATLPLYTSFAPAPRVLLKRSGDSPGTDLPRPRRTIHRH
jgi:predicted NBD/HSP70 family sugar kinase